MSKKGHGKWLLQSLILSIALNIVFVFLLYSAVFRKDIYKLGLFSGPMIVTTRSSAVFPGNLLEILNTIPLKDLFLLLDSNGTIHGRPLRQFALGAAVSFHHFDLVRAIEKPVSLVELEEKGRKIIVPEGLSLEDYEAAKRFFLIEKYPYTTEGLFSVLSKGLDEGEVEEDAILSFCATPEFLYVRTLLAGAEEEVSSVASLVRMLISGGKDLFFSLCSEKSRATFVSDGARRQFLSAYFMQGYSLAALLMLVHDADYVLHVFSDERLTRFVQLLPASSLEAQCFMKKVLSSPRSEEIKIFVKKLLENSGVEVVNKSRSAGLGGRKRYIVQSGDSLWLIAKRFGISVERLIAENNKKNGKIIPGESLTIPED